MKFATATIGTLDVRVLLVPPDIGNGFSVAHQFDTIIGEGRTTIEERRPGRSAMLLMQKVTLFATGNDLDDFRKGLAALGEKPVAMPLWIDALPVARWGERIYEPQKVINFDPDSGAFAIYDAGSLPGSPAHPLYAPLLIGRWDKRPTAKALSGNTATVEMTLREASPYDCRIGVNTQAGGWTALPNWKSPPEEVSDYGLEQIALEGVAAREPGLDRENAAARWTQTGNFLFTSRLLIRQHLSHFVAMRGAWQSWSPLPSWFQAGADTSFTPDDYTARFATDTLTLNFISGATATARVGFIQEIDTGARSQALPAEAYLYRVDYDVTPAYSELWTSWDATLTGAEGDFLPTQITHQEIVASLKPQNVTAEVAFGYIAGSLFADWIRARVFKQLTLTVEKCDPDDVAGTRTELFSGLVQNVLPEGNTLRVTAELQGELLKSKVPGWTDSARCNVCLFSAECTLSEAAFDSDGTLSNSGADLSADGMSANIRTVTGWGGPAFSANWFARGTLRTGSGRNTVEVGIVSSAAASGGTVAVAFNRPVPPDLIAGAGQAVQLLPGCDGQYTSSCIGKFGNGVNFRGLPFIPEYIASEVAASPKVK